MNRFVQFGTRITLVLAIALVGVLSVTHTARAQGIVIGDSVPEGTRIDSDGVLYGDKITINGMIDGDVLAIGREVIIDGDVTGSLFVAGEKVIINGKVGGTVYGAGANFELAEMASLNRNIYFAGLSLVTYEDSIVGRDLVAASLGAQLAGTVNGDIRAIVGPLEFFYLIMDKVDEAGLLQNTAPAAPAATPEPESETGQQPLRVSSVWMASASMVGIGPALGMLERDGLQQAGGVDWDEVGNWSLDRLRALVTLSIFGLLAIWLIPKVITVSAEKLREKPLPGTGFGLLALVIAFNLLGVVLLLAVIILAIGMFLGFSTLWELAWAFMALGFFGLGLAATIFGIFVLYISKVIVAYLVGYVILNRLAPGVIRYKILSLLLGLVIYVLLVGIPILGWVIGLLVTALGLGAAWLYYKDRRAFRGDEAEVVEVDE